MAEVGILGPDDRVELIEGEIIDMPPPGELHAGTVSQLDHLLQRAAGDRAIVFVQNPAVLGRYSAPQPDLALLRPRDGLLQIGAPSFRRHSADHRSRRHFPPLRSRRQGRALRSAHDTGALADRRPRQETYALSRSDSRRLLARRRARARFARGDRRVARSGRRSRRRFCGLRDNGHTNRRRRRAATPNTARFASPEPLRSPQPLGDDVRYNNSIPGETSPCPRHP